MNDLEAAFDRGFAKFLSQSFLRVAQPDFPTRKKPKQIVDRLLLHQKSAFAFELKQTKGKSFPFSRFRPHQIQFLEEFQQKVGKGYFICSFDNLRHVFLIPIHEFLHLRKMIGKKSFNLKDASQYFSPIGVQTGRSLPRLDLRFLCVGQTRLTSFVQKVTSPS